MSRDRLSTSSQGWRWVLLLELKLCLFQTTKLCSQSKHQKPQLLSVWFALPHWIKYHTQKKLSQRKTQRYALSIWKHCLDFLLAPKPTRFSNTWKLGWKKIVVCGQYVTEIRGSIREILSGFTRLANTQWKEGTCARLLHGYENKKAFCEVLGLQPEDQYKRIFWG